MEKVLQNKFSIGYYKYKHLELQSLEQNYNDSNDLFEYNPFKIDKLQNYNPVYNLLFTLSSKNYNNIQLNQPYHFINTNAVLHENERLDKSVFIKYSPLLAKYTSPSLIDCPSKIVPKISLPDFKINRHGDSL